MQDPFLSPHLGVGVQLVGLDGTGVELLGVDGAGVELPPHPAVLGRELNSRPIVLFLALFFAALLAAGCAGQGFATIVPATAVPIATTISSTEAPTSGATTAATAIPASPTIAATPAPAITPSATLGTADLKYRLIAQFGDPFFCDPDYYPVAHVVSDSEIEQKFAQIQSDASVYQAILAHLGLSSQSTLSVDQKRAIYAEYKKLNSIELQASGDKYQFRMRIPATQRTGFAIEGMIDSAGSISVTSKQPSFNTCPICLAVNSLIATPNGEIPVQDLREGMPVWTADARGAKITAVVLATVRRDLPGLATLVHIALQDGRELFVSPGHPLSDGRIVADLAAGDLVDGSRILRLDDAPYQGGATYDILPSGETGLYWANGILLKSTLAR